MDFFRGMKLIGGNVPFAPPVKEEVVSTDNGKVKRGRPNMKEKKKELRKAQMSALDMFIESKPSKAKVRDYFENRIKALRECD